MLTTNTSTHSTYTYALRSGDLPAPIITNSLHQRLREISQRNKWIMFTAECSREIFDELREDSYNYQHVVQLKPSKHDDEYEVVVKALCSGNASTVVASNNISPTERTQLQCLAIERRCDIYFVNGSELSYH